MHRFKKSKIDSYDKIFIPGSPIQLRKYLFGREQEIKDLKNVLKRPGQNAIVIGYRGVGKTSLVKQVLKDHQYHSIWRTCDPDSTYYNVFCDLLEETGTDLRNYEETLEKDTEREIKGEPFGIGISGKSNIKKTNKIYAKKAEHIRPWTIYKCLEQIEEKIILVLDEYDAIHSSVSPDEFNRNTAYTIKQLSDNSDKCDSRIVVVGVAASSAELLGKHESIQRCAREIFLRPLRREDILDFLNVAEGDLGVTFEDKVKERIAKGSLGFPYFLHLVGLECISSMLERDKTSKRIIWKDLVIGLNKAVDQAFRSELVKYRSILDPANVAERRLIEGMALAPTPYPKRNDLYEFMKNNYKMDVNTFNSSLLSLTQQKSFLYLSRRNDEVRFIDPLMKAFIKERMLLNKKAYIKENPQFELFDHVSDDDTYDD